MKMSLKIKFILVAILMIAARTSMNAQRIAVTTNVVEDAILTPNVGVDIVLSDRQSITFDTSFAPYQLSKGFSNKCMTFRAGYKYWLNQAFYAHYIGVDVVASSNDFRLGSWKQKGEYLGIGVGYGYSLILSKRLNLVPHIGVGIAYGNSYEGHDHMNGTQGVQAVATPRFMPILTRFGLTIQYVLN